MRIDPFLGVRINTSRYCPEWDYNGPLVQCRFPRSRKRRVQKKWAKRAANWKPSRVRFVVNVGGVLVMHPATYYAITGG